tara:strand:+ start:1704 stop:1943 length:240 start_codon:yes stop_codon:yes gene_type:complete
MPRYEHKCLHCFFVFEITYGINEEPDIKCPKCSSYTKRQISKNVLFSTPVDVDWEGDPSDLGDKSHKQYKEAKKIKYTW